MHNSRQSRSTEHRTFIYKTNEGYAVASMFDGQVEVFSTGYKQIDNRYAAAIKQYLRSDNERPDGRKPINMVPERFLSVPGAAILDPVEMLSVFGELETKVIMFGPKRPAREEGASQSASAVNETTRY